MARPVDHALERTRIQKYYQCTHKSSSGLQCQARVSLGVVLRFYILQSTDGSHYTDDAGQ
jgi:hypothetical protein